jgi:hypothetical protein
MGTGIGFLVVGLMCITLPHWLALPLEWLVGAAMFFAGLTGACHLLAGLLAMVISPVSRLAQTRKSIDRSAIGKSSATVARRSPFWLVVLLQLIVGWLSLTSPEVIRPYWLLALMAGIAVEGCLILWVSVHFHSLSTKIGLWANGLFSIVVVVVVMWKWQHVDAVYWIAALLGSKFLMLGWIFFQVGLNSNDSDLRMAYVGDQKFQETPQVGFIYAVYYGPAFHCGISVGEGQIVDYLSDGIVRLISWEEFLLGRRALEWNYPDVTEGEPERISQFARGLVGKYNKYDAFRFNCENLAIYCRSVGHTTYSNFSQASVGVEIVKRKPILGSMVQILNRGASWFLYGAGGPFGKKIGFAMIRVASAFTDWVVARPLRQSSDFSVPQEPYFPNFADRQPSSSA